MKRLAFNTILVIVITGCIVFFASNTIRAPDESALSATFQPYENGFLLWRSDLNCIYIFATSAQSEDGNIIILPDAVNNYTYCNPVDSADDNAFSRLVADYNLADTLGATHGDSVTYTFDPATRTLPDSTTGFSGSPYDQLQLPLPDGRLLWCGVRAATAGTCHLTDAENTQ